VLFDGDGGLALADERVLAWLGLGPGDLTAASFLELTGIDVWEGAAAAPGEVLRTAEPRPLVITVRAFSLGGRRGVLVVLQPDGPGAAMEVEQVHLQEELFAQLRRDVATPMRLIQRFLEDPQPGGLGAARAALEQVRNFLADFLCDDGRPPSEPAP
jgi:hypothetical protein